MSSACSRLRVSSINSSVRVSPGFLHFVNAQKEAETEPTVAPVSGGDSEVTLMSIHQSKGLEFPVVVVADLAKPFQFLRPHG